MLATLLAVLVGGAGGCATRTGWERTTSRVCERSGPPVLCVSSTPDAPLEVRAGGAEILPGECAVAGPKARGGALAVEVKDGRGARDVARVGVRRGKRTTVRVGDRADVDVQSRERCDRTP